MKDVGCKSSRGGSWWKAWDIQRVVLDAELEEKAGKQRNYNQGRENSAANEQVRKEMRNGEGERMAWYQWALASSKPPFLLSAAKGHGSHGKHA